MEPMILFWLWAIALTIQVAIAVALYQMAERRFSNGFVWAWMGLLFGWLALIIYGAVVLFDASMEHSRETAERAKLQRFMKEHMADRAGASKSESTLSGGDSQLEQLLAAGRYEAARQHVTELLRQAHEMGDQSREDVYRSYFKRIDDAAGTDGA